MDDFSPDENSEELLEQRMNNMGFTNAEVEELYAQGVKPWDDDAWVSTNPSSLSTLYTRLRHDADLLPECSSCS